MGVKYGGEYIDIINELVIAIGEIEGVNNLFEMDEKDWMELEETTQKECLLTLADDIFYALGENGSIKIGNGSAQYDEDRHIIKVHTGSKISIINLL